MDKQQKQEKPKWTKPELTALVRNKPEEAVLTACKEWEANPGSGFQATQNGCWQVSCQWCQVYATS